MIMRKLTILFVMLCLMEVIPANAGIGQTLTVNGETIEKTVAKVTFEGDDLVLHFSDETTLKADMAVVTIAFDASSGISTVLIGEMRRLVDDQLVLGNVPQGAKAILFDAAGKQLLTTTDSTIDMRRMKSGVYMLKVGSQIVKFMKR